MKILIAKLVENKEITAAGCSIDGVISDMTDFGGDTYSYYRLLDGSFNIYNSDDEVVAFTETWNCPA